MFRRHPFLSLATFAYLGFVGWVTLGPQPINDHGNSVLHWFLHLFARYDATNWIDYNRLEFLANVGMFVPIGMFFLLLFGRRLFLVATLAGVALTCAIEFTQLFLPDRVSDLRDIVANSVGALVGVVLTLVLTWGTARRIRRESRALVGSADRQV